MATLDETYLIQLTIKDKETQIERKTENERR